MRNNGSMMLMNALQNMRPRVPQFADAPEPQASIYAEKAANEGALGAWQHATGLQDRAAGRASAEGMSQASLSSALQRAMMADKRAAADAAMRERLKGRELDQGADQFTREIGLKADQFDRDLGWKKERAPQEDQLRRDLADKATAAARARAQRMPPLPKPEKAPNYEDQFEDADRNLNMLISRNMDPLTWQNINPKAAQVEQARINGELQNLQRAIRAARANFNLAKFRGDRAGMDRNLAVLAQLNAGGGPPPPEQPTAPGMDDDELPPEAEAAAQEAAMRRMQQGQ